MSPVWRNGERIQPRLNGYRTKVMRGGVATHRTPSGIIVPSTQNIYWGARIDGAHYVATGRTADGTDPPFGTTNWNLFETDATRAISVLHWGTGAAEWPWGGIGATTSGLIRTRGAFSHYSISTSSLQGNTTSGLGDLLALANNYAIRTAQPAGTTNGDAAIRAIDSLEKLFGSNAIVGGNTNSIMTRGHPTMVRPFWEFNGGWFPWGISATSNGTSSSGGNSSEWGPTFTTLTPTGTEQRIVSHIAVWRMMFRAACDGHAGQPIGTNAAGGTGATINTPNTGPITFCWCPNSITNPLGGGVPDFTAWYPGDAFVHWTGADIYADRGSAPYPYKTVAALWDTTINKLLSIAPTKPIFMAEIGFWDNTASPGKAQQITDLLTSYIPAHPAIKGFTWFEQDAAEPGVFIETESAALAAFQAGINDTTHGVSYLAAPVQGTNLSFFTSGSPVPDPSVLSRTP